MCRRGVFCGWMTFCDGRRRRNREAERAGVRILCVIPVRGGSKGILNKNALDVVPGVPLLAWTVRQALAAYPWEDVVVSTEDAVLTEIARKAGARVEARPPELARDESTTADVVGHLLETLDPTGKVYQAIAVLQVTSPLRQVDDIHRSIALFRSGTYDSVVSAYETSDCHPAKLYFRTAEGARSVAPEHQYARRQDLPPVFRRNGAVFMVTRAHFQVTGCLWGGTTGLVEMPQERSIDIDAPKDLETARSYIQARRDDFPN